MSTTEQKPEAGNELAEFYQDLEANFLPPLWHYLSQIISLEPVADARPYKWAWNEVYPRILKAGDVPIERGGERRVLILNNPGLADLKTATRNIYAGVQLVKPGEVAPAHRHVQSAIRFIIQGNGAYTAVNGERCYMHQYDLLLTPPWTWHDHGNPSPENVIWMDGLDANLVRSLDASFFELHPDYRQPITKPDNFSLKTFGGGSLGPAWFPPASSEPGLQASSPLLIYPWAKTYAALKELESTEIFSPYDDVMLNYLNPQTGGPVLPTLSCSIQLLRPGVHTQTHRHTSSAVYHVVAGSGFTVINGQTTNWSKGDFIVLPPWAWHEHANASPTEEAILFSVTDKPVLEKLGFYREEANGGQP